MKSIFVCDIYLVYKVEKGYDKKYCILDKSDADFYILILGNG